MPSGRRQPAVQADDAIVRSKLRLTVDLTSRSGHLQTLGSPRPLPSAAAC